MKINKLTPELEEDNKRIEMDNAKREGYVIFPIENYPNDGSALRCYTDYPCKIEKGRDEFVFKNKWYVMFDCHFSIEDKCFSNIGQALYYMKASYLKWLKNQLELINKGKLK